MGTGMFGYQIRVMPKAVAGAFNLHHDGMMQEAIKQSCRDHRIAEDITPFSEATV